MSNAMKKLIIWICNAVVAVFCVLAIAGYFFAPVWRININVALQADDFKEIVESITKNDSDLKNLFGENADFKEILGADSFDISLALSMNGSTLFNSFSGEGAIEELIGNNVDTLVDQITGILVKVIPTAAKSVAKNVVKDEINSNVKKHLDSLTENSDVTMEEVKSKLENANITDEYIDEKIDELIDSVFEGEGTKKENVTEKAMDIVDEVYGKLQASDDPDFKDIEITEEDKEAIRQKIDEALDEIADENGEIDAETLLDKLLSGVFGSSDEEGKAGIKTLAAEPAPDKGSAQLKEKLRSMIMDKLGNGTVRTALVWAMRGICIFMMLTWIPWIYIIVKLIVKLATGSKDQTVRLKAPIIFGWLPFLILYIIPSIALLFAKGTITKLLVQALPEGLGVLAEGIGISFFSSGWMALLAAGICLGVSIFYIILRKKMKDQPDEEDDETEQIEESEENEQNEEIAISDDENN